MAFGNPSTGLVIPYVHEVTNKAVFDTINTVLSQHQEVTTIVVGRPTTFTGKDTAVTIACDAFCSELARAYPDIAVVGSDERSSTKKALSKLNGIATKKDPRSHHAAAAQILEDFLAFERK